MPDDSKQPAEPVSKSVGITKSERYLQRLCEKNFLSLWSYPRPFRDQGGNKELCDLLVIMGDNVIVFSDKHCTLEPKTTLNTDWQRWFRSAIRGAAKQAWGAERWLRQHPHRVFLDPACTRPLPVSIPTADNARFHLVVTTHGVSAACQAMFGGTGSLVLNTNLTSFDEHVEPFHIGDLDPERTFVHVLDDTTLDFVMDTLDTTADFLRYLSEKERACRARTLLVAGEENMLAYYLTHLDEDGKHALVLDSDADVIVIDESHWEEFESSNERQAQLKADEISYLWDKLIEQFAQHALSATQYHATEPAFESSEIVLRCMAAEPRFRRRFLGDTLLAALKETPPDKRRLRVIPNQDPHEPMYVFLLFPWRVDKSEDENRLVRRKYLEACIYVARMKHRDALDVVGIATESGAEIERRSEDALYFDARTWTAEDDQRAREYQQDFGILINERQFSQYVKEYPVPDEPPLTIPKNPRNKPCPCGSNRKYKHCHGA